MLLLAVAFTIRIVSCDNSHELLTDQCPSGTSTSVDGTGCLGETGDEAQLQQRKAAPGRQALLQQALQVQKVQLAQARASKLAFTLDGGGWTALSVQTGVMVGLLAGIGKEKGIASPTLENTGILDSVEVVSTVSGGSWFASELIYSKSFLDLVNNMAADPKSASTQFMEAWIKPYFHAFSDHSGVALELIEKLGGKFGSTTQKQLSSVLGILGATLKGGHSWASAIALLLRNTANIPEALTLGSAEANSWAHGKVWLACNSLAIPSGQQRLWAFISHPFGTASYKYWAPSEAASAPHVIPSKISWRIGDVGATSPFPFVASTALPPDTKLKWMGVKEEFFWKSKWSKSFSPDNFASLESGKLPLYKVVASSSAILGGTTMSANRNLPQVFAEFRLRLPVYAAADPGAYVDAFTAADRILKTPYVTDKTDQATTDALGQAGVFAIYDGAYTDNTGIGQAVAAGATSIMSIINGGFGSLTQLFIEQSATSVTMFKLVKGTNFGIFTFPGLGGTTAQDHVNKLISGFSKLDTTGSKHLKAIQVGKLEVVTRANEWFGIEAGRHVSLTVMNIDASLGGVASKGVPIVSENDAGVVGELAQDIANAVMKEENKHAVDLILHSLKER